jgi:hypothetical protein
MWSPGDTGGGCDGCQVFAREAGSVATDSRRPLAETAKVPELNAPGGIHGKVIIAL